MVNDAHASLNDSDVGEGIEASEDLDLSVMMVLGSDSVGAPVLCYTVSKIFLRSKNWKRVGLETH